MSTVYFARDRNLDCYWAVKHVKNDGNVQFEAFKKEVELLSKLNHPDVPRIVDRIEIDDDFFVCMDFIDGSTLGSKLKKEGAQGEKDVVEWAKLLCDILHYLHTKGKNPIIYRDMKPDNIMLGTTGRVKLIDFGIAKEIVRGEIPRGEKLLTKRYAAPEQFKDAPMDERTDIYSLGVTLHHLVTGIVPSVPKSNQTSTVLRPIRQINPLLSEGLEYIINKCIQIDPENRYQNCLELKYDLDNIEKLNSKYNKEMKNKALAFSLNVAGFVVCLALTLAGSSGMSKVKAQNYQQAFSRGMNYEQSKDYASAEASYIAAIDHDPDRVDTYLRLFNVLLPKSNDEDFTAKTKYAIDSIRKYVDNKYSPIHNNPHQG